MKKNLTVFVFFSRFNSKYSLNLDKKFWRVWAFVNIYCCYRLYFVVSLSEIEHCKIIIQGYESKLAIDLCLVVSRQLLFVCTFIIANLYNNNIDNPYICITRKQDYFSIKYLIIPEMNTNELKMAWQI